MKSIHQLNDAQETIREVVGEALVFLEHHVYLVALLGVAVFYGFFFFTMALHFVVNDDGLREHHKQLYHRIGRWILAAAIIVGCAQRQWYEYSLK